MSCFFYRNPESFTSVSPVDITAAHLISYDPQQDILPMVLTNTQYSIDICKGTKITYFMSYFFYRNPESFTSASPVDITAAHLISYDPQQDILPMVLANCQYSFEIGKGTKIEYDFKGLERQLMDRFFYSKSRINIERVLQVRK